MKYKEFINWSDYHYLVGKLTEFEDQDYEFILDVFFVIDDDDRHIEHALRYSSNKDVKINFDNHNTFDTNKIKNIRYEVFDYGGRFNFKWLYGKVKHKFKEYRAQYQTGQRLYLEPR